MYSQELSIPFGLLYEEEAPTPSEIFHPTYDELEGLSFLEDSQGRRVPFVEFGNYPGTQTETKIYRETTDTDPGDDHSNVLVLATTTSTAVRAETTDTDIGADSLDTYPNNVQGHQSIWRSMIATDTITKMENEPTDRD
jgi:hypothetical protein